MQTGNDKVKQAILSYLLLMCNSDHYTTYLSSCSIGTFVSTHQSCHVQGKCSYNNSHSVTVILLYFLLFFSLSPRCDCGTYLCSKYVRYLFYATSHVWRSHSSGCNLILIDVTCQRLRDVTCQTSNSSL